MKRFILFARLYSWLVIALPAAASAQNKVSYPNYVVIGAFAHQRNAVKFTEEANQKNLTARFEMNPNRNLYYVYVTSTYDSAQAFSEALKLRKETKYFDTWVYHGAFGEMRLSDSPGQVQDINPVTGEQMESVAKEQRPSPQERQPQRSNAQSDRTESTLNPPSSPFPAEATVLASGGNDPEQNANSEARIGQPVITSVAAPQLSDKTVSAPEGSVTGEQTEAPATSDNRLSKETKTTGPQSIKDAAPVRIYSKQETTTPLTSEEVVGRDFLFQLYRADNLVIIDGEVEAVDVEKSRRMATYQANTPVKVLMPSGNSKHMFFVSNVFGYRKMQREFDPLSLPEDLYLDKEGNLVVPFELVRLQKGDIAIMYNVFFFKDAAVMRPESRYEVNNLLDLLKENPDYKIRIHGHTNGNASGKIIRMDKPGNFYSLSGTNQGFGSAKKLSEERAIVIKQYLVSSGISEDRMQIKAWGGKKPIHDKHSVRANENVRVEIEILSE